MIARAWLRLALVPTLLLGAAGARAQTPTAATVADRLTDVRAALGTDAWARHGRGLRVTGPARLLGEEAEHALDARPDGAFALAVTGPLSTRGGFDGTTCWSVDWAGTPHVLELEDREEALLTTWMITGYWAAPDAPVEVTGDDEGLTVRLRPGSLGGRLALDPETHLPARLEREGPESAWALVFEGWREHDGVVLPGAVTFLEEGIEARHLELETVEPAPDTLASPYEPPRAGPDDARFDPAVDAALESRRAPTGHLLVRARLGADEPSWWIFDTGAGAMCVDRKVADELGLERVGKVPVRGVGGVVEGAFRRGAPIVLGPMTMEAPVFVELELGFLDGPMGVPIAGVVGFGAFARCVAEVDMREGRAAIHDPAGYELRDASWVPLSFTDRHPCVPARFEGDREGLFKIDTGAGSFTVTFHAHAVRELGLLEGRAVRDAAAGGVGGVVATRSGALEWFELGGHRFERPEVAFAVGDTGAFGNRYTTGVVGGRFLAPFVMITDYGHRRAAFRARE